MSDSAALLSDVHPASARQLLLAALEEFAARGYHATTTRDIGRRAGYSPAAVYTHYPSKGALLYELSRIGHTSALEVVEAASRGDADPPERLRRMVRDFAAWHAEHHQIARVIQYELGALPAEGYAQVRSLRRRINTLFEDELRRGISAGNANVADVPGTSLAILSLCIDVARWYVPSRNRRPDAIGELYGDLAVRMVFVEAPDSAA